MPPRKRGRITPNAQRGVVKLLGNSKYRIEKPRYPQPKWVRNNSGRLVSTLPRRPNIGGLGTLEVYYHVDRETPDEVLPPPKTLWRQRYGNQHTISYRPLWVGIADNLTKPLRRRSDVSVESGAGDLEGNVGVPYLYTYDEDLEPDEDGEQYRRWQPLKIIANGGYGVVITYVDEAREFTVDADIADEDIMVAKFNYKGGDLVDIMASVVNQITMSEEIRRAQREDEEDIAANPGPKAAAARRGEVEKDIGTVGKKKKSAWERRLEWRRRRSEEEEGTHYSHFQAPSTVLDVDVDATDMFRQETQVLEILDMTGSPHFPKFWKLADPPQDGTLCTMNYIPGGRTLDEQLDTMSNEKVHIRLIWEAVLCLSKAMSVMAYGSEDPAPSHRVHGWNQIVHLDWSAPNIFVRQNHPSHTCSHGPCFTVGDFGFALIVPNRPEAKKAFRLRHLKFGWHKILNPRLPVSRCHDLWSESSSNCELEQEANIDAEVPFKKRIESPVIGHFSHKTNAFLMAQVWRDNLGGNKIGRIGVMRYMQDNLTQVERIKLAKDLESHLPEDERLGKPLEDGDDDSGSDSNSDDNEDNADDHPLRVRGYVDLAESLMGQRVAQSTRVSEQRFVNLMIRCLDDDPEKRPEIEEIMLQAARGMAEAGVYVPPPPSSSDSDSSGDSENED